jgi:uncharacterized protein
MSAANRELIQTCYDNFARGDAAAVLGVFHPQIIWNEAENFIYADGNPYMGPQRVAEGVFGRLVTEWDGYTVMPERVLADGDTVIALGRYRGTYRATGGRVDAQFVHVWEIEDGRITRFQQYTDTAQFAQVQQTAPLLDA